MFITETVLVLRDHHKTEKGCFIIKERGRQVTERVRLKPIFVPFNFNHQVNFVHSGVGFLDAVGKRLSNSDA